MALALRSRSSRWREHVRQTTSNLGGTARCIHAGGRESHMYALLRETPTRREASATDAP